ncbi:RNA-directed DNA polymerase, eukaryota, reverse transcriptase zinc-binding domain protein [Tanacetum coccineum]
MLCKLIGNAADIQCYNREANGHYARECPKLRVWDSKNFMKQMLLAKKVEAEHNDFLLADVDQMEKIKELSTNICMMVIIQQENIDSDEGPSYDFAFISEDQINSDIIFDDPNVEVNDRSIKHDKNAHDSHDMNWKQLG